MSNRKREQVIRVDNLVIHAKNVEIINEGRDHDYPRRDHDYPRRDPWGFFWGRQQPSNLGEQEEIMDVEVEDENIEDHHHN
ncbi:hypothetical protein [Fredinandcohnia quinoae]|uniref:Uncharacterized protein n=1 Tax=Fredinandcohnia quinoae TaxID=2918902 RepID=A0AAW5E299_9BACI|nr:hypothetical protein [Fredinandcohnia sp. SECRCQ15]MCH1627030.1 hypothetical protein [Fredinandcohnia sp. SECRCQ15]